MIYLDTHVVVWLYAGITTKLSEYASESIMENELLISPIVRLELQYLYEIGRIKETADTILTDLESRIGLSICPTPFNTIVTQSLQLDWTRDPFDRLIVGNAADANCVLLTKDFRILDNFELARW